MLIGALGYTISFLLYSLNKTSYGYWPMIFPGLCLSVVGADFEFNVTNVSGNKFSGIMMLVADNI
jgi:nitrate/nitrite transporter NarK